MDPVTVIGLIAVICLFLLGLGLVWFGMARRPSTGLPAGADQLLAAVAAGQLAGRLDDDRPVRVTRPPSQPPVADTVASSAPPVQPPRADHDKPAVRLVPRTTDLPAAIIPVVPTRSAETRQPAATGAAMPVRQREPAQAPPAPAAAVARPGGTFDSLDEVPSPAERKFFAQPAKLRRI